MKAPFRVVLALVVGVVSVSTALTAQRNVTLPQPQAGSLPQIGPARPNRGGIVDKPATVMPTVPAGFTVTVAAELPAPRMMVFAPNGDLFVSSPGSNNITILRDANKDGVYEERFVYAQGDQPQRGAGAAGQQQQGQRQGGAAAPAAPAPQAAAAVNPTVNGPILGTEAPSCVEPQAFASAGTGTLAAPFGLAFQGGYLWVGNTGSIVRYRYTPGDTKAQGAPEKVLNMPVGGHSTRNIIFNKDAVDSTQTNLAAGRMFVAVGSQSNNNAGEPCNRAAVLQFNPDGGAFKVFASGLRNPVGLAIHPITQQLWTVVNERDNLGDDLVPDYATSLKEDGHYGWPYSYIGQNYDPRYEGAFPELFKRAIVPDVLFPSHSAPLGITFYTGTAFPEKYRNGAFVALHGSWNRSTASGYKVVFFPTDIDGKAGPLEDFMTGFIVNDGTNGEQIQRWGRPVGVTVTPDGALLVSDDGGNRIWRVAAAR